MKDSLRALRFLYSYPLRYPAAMTAATISMLLGLLCSIALPVVMAVAINVGVLHGKPSLLLGLAIGVLGVGVFATGAQQIGKRIRFTVASNAVTDLRSDLFRRLLQLGQVDLADASGGRALTRLISDAVTVRGITNGGLFEFFNQALLTAATLIAALLIDWRTTFLAIIPILLVTLMNFRAQLRLQRVFSEVKSQFTRLVFSTGESLANIRLVKSSGSETVVSGRLNSISKEHSARQGKMARGYGRWGGVLNIMGGLAIPIALLIGGNAVIDNRLSAGSLVALIALIMIFQMGMQMVVMHINTALHNVVVGQRLQRVVDASPVLVEDPAGGDMPRPAGELTTDNLGVEIAGRRVLDAVNLRVAPGESVAITGPPGSGKTTLLQALARLRDPDSGMVAYDGTDARTFTIASIRRHVLCLPQRQWIFEGTLAENVRFARPDAACSEIQAAVNAAELGHIPLSRKLTATTMDLSAGERQRIGLARALLADPQVLLLDDPTANLDGETQTRFLETLFRVRGRRTVIIATHQLAAARYADRTISLDRTDSVPAA